MTESKIIQIEPDKSITITKEEYLMLVQNFERVQTLKRYGNTLFIPEEIKMILNIKQEDSI